MPTQLEKTSERPIADGKTWSLAVKEKGNGCCFQGQTL